MNFSAMVMHFEIPVVEVLDPVTDPRSFIDQIRSLEDGEGVIVAWENGKRVKAKSEWYVRIHRAKDSVIRENGVLELILNNEIDDVKSFLPASDRHALDLFETKFYAGITQTAATWATDNQKIRSIYGTDRKKFAIEQAPRLDPNFRGHVFKAWEEGKYDWHQAVIDVVRKNLGTSTKVNEVRYLFGNIKWDQGTLVE